MKILRQDKDLHIYEGDDKICKNPALVEQAKLIDETTSPHNNELYEAPAIQSPLLGDRVVQKFSMPNQEHDKPEPKRSSLSGKNIQKFSHSEDVDTPAKYATPEERSTALSSSSVTVTQQQKQQHHYAPLKLPPKTVAPEGFFKKRARKAQNIWKASQSFVTANSAQNRSLSIPSRKMVDEFHENKRTIPFQGRTINYANLVKYTFKKNAFEAESIKWLFPIDPEFAKLRGEPNERVIIEKRKAQVIQNFQILTNLLGYKYNPQTQTLHLAESRSVQRERMHFLRKNAMAEFSLNKILNSLDNHGLYKEKSLLQEALALSLEDEENKTTHYDRFKDRIRRSIQTEGRACTLIITIACKLLKLST